jgi:hypothetical protein
MAPFIIGSVQSTPESRMAILILSLLWGVQVDSLEGAVLESLILVKKGSISSMNVFAYFTLEKFLSEDRCHDYEGLPVAHFLCDPAMSKSSNNSSDSNVCSATFGPSHGLGIPSKS